MGDSTSGWFMRLLMLRILVDDTVGFEVERMIEARNAVD